MAALNDKNLDKQTKNHLRNFAIISSIKEKLDNKKINGNPIENSEKLITHLNMQLFEQTKLFLKTFFRVTVNIYYF